MPKYLISVFGIFNNWLKFTRILLIKVEKKATRVSKHNEIFMTNFQIPSIIFYLEMPFSRYDQRHNKRLIFSHLKRLKFTTGYLEHVLIS